MSRDWWVRALLAIYLLPGRCPRCRLHGPSFHGGRPVGMLNSLWRSVTGSGPMFLVSRWLATAANITANLEMDAVLDPDFPRRVDGDSEGHRPAADIDVATGIRRLIHVTSRCCECLPDFDYARDGLDVGDFLRFISSPPGRRRGRPMYWRPTPSARPTTSATGTSASRRCFRPAGADPAGAAADAPIRTRASSYEGAHGRSIGVAARTAHHGCAVLRWAWSC